MQVTFYKGVLQKDLSNSYIPGSVTTDIKEALMWKDRISSKKNKGPAKHVRHGPSVIIKMTVDVSSFKDCKEFQREGVQEHLRDNCWMNTVRSKAQVNQVVPFVILTEQELSSYSLL